MKRLFCVLLAVALLASQSGLNASALSAKSAVVISGDTGEILYAHNKDARMSMASTTKIMTALLLCEHGNFQREITVTAPMVAVEGSSMGLRVGDRITLLELLYGLMLSSGNDAANAVAIVLGGSIEGFAFMMNQRAKEMGLKNTSFVTPSGLDADNHYTTAHELALITKTAMQNPVFCEVVSTKSITVNFGNPPSPHYLKNHNRLLGEDGYIGVKTGFTKKSGRCLVSAYKSDGKFLIAVTLRAPDDWADHRRLMDIGLNACESTELMPASPSVKIPIVCGVQPEMEIVFSKATLTSGKDGEISANVYLPERLCAPVLKGDKLGCVEYVKSGEVILREEIVAPVTVKAKRHKKSEKFYTLFLDILSAV